MWSDMGRKLSAAAPAASQCDGASGSATLYAALGEGAYQAPETRGEIGRSSTNEKRVPLPSSVSTFRSPAIA